MQKEIEELDEKIERIEFDQSMIEKNNKKGIKGDERIYYTCCLCCENEESLEQIKEREEKEKKMNELIESSKENTSEYFCGAAFVTFNTIKDQEDYLSHIQKNCCRRLMDAFITLFKIFFIVFVLFYVVAYAAVVAFVVIVLVALVIKNL